MKLKNLIRFDWAMKRLLRNKANFGVLEGFLSELLKEDIVIEQILESESNQNDVNQKYNRVDLLALNAKKELIIVEIQNNSEWDYLYRILFATSKTTTEYFDVGQQYKDIKKVYSVNIVYFDLGQGSDYVYHGKTEFKGIHTQDLLGLSKRQKIGFGIDNIHNIFPEYYLIKVNNFNDIAKDTLDEWIYYFKNNSIGDNPKAKGLKLAKEKLILDSLSPEDRFSYIKNIENIVIEKDVMSTARIEGYDEGYDEGIEKGIEEGIQKGIEKGIEEGIQKGIEKGIQKGIEKGIEKGIKQASIEAAQRLKTLGVLSIQQIADITQLTTEEINLL